MHSRIPESPLFQLVRQVVAGGGTVTFEGEDLLGDGTLTPRLRVRRVAGDRKQGLDRHCRVELDAHDGLALFLKEVS